MSQRRSGGIKVCPEFAEMIRGSAQTMVKLDGKVSMQWVEVNKEFALWDEINHKERRFWFDAWAGDKLMNEINEELRVNVKKWRERR